jgi:hypothetical protein
MRQIFVGVGVRRTGSNVRSHNVFEIAAIPMGDLANDVMPFVADIRLSTMKDFGAVSAGVMDAAEFSRRTTSGSSADAALNALETWLATVKTIFQAEQVHAVFNDALDQLFLLDLYAARRMTPGFEGYIDVASYFMGVVGTLPSHASHEHIVAHLEVGDIPFATALDQAAFAAGAFCTLSVYRTTRVTYDAAPVAVPKDAPEAPVATKPAWLGSRGKNPTRIGMPAVIPTAIAPKPPAAMPTALRPTMVQREVVPTVLAAFVPAAPRAEPAEAIVTWPSDEAARKRFRASTPGDGSYSAKPGSEDHIPIAVTRRRGIVVTEEHAPPLLRDPRREGVI